MVIGASASTAGTSGSVVGWGVGAVDMVVLTALASDSEEIGIATFTTFSSSARFALLSASQSSHFHSSKWVSPYTRKSERGQ